MVDHNKPFGGLIEALEPRALLSGNGTTPDGGDWGDGNMIFPNG